MPSHTTSALRRWRQQHDLTLEEVADLTGLSKAYISRLEAGSRSPAALTQVRIARRLNTPVRELFPISERGEST